MELPRSRDFAAATVALPAPDALVQTEYGRERAAPDPIIVVGGGPAGLRAAHEIARRGMPVVLFNAERWAPYNRVKLTPFLAGEVQIGRVYQEDVASPDAPVVRYDNHTIVHIDRTAKAVQNQVGRRWRYAKLVLALGSRPHVPPIPGRELSGVFRFRSFDDVEKLLARSVRSRRTVVIGGGLLGLEAARGMSLRRVPTVVVEHEHRLMPQQLDGEGGRLLRQAIERIGIGVRTGCAVKSIDGTDRVESVRLSSGETIRCDTVIICTGIRSNIELAIAAGIAVGRGIAVNDAMQTSDPDVYAVGECAEHRGHVYGLVAPGLEQAAVAAAHIGGAVARYAGSAPTTRLKVVGTDVFSMGDVEQLDQRDDLRSLCWQDAEAPAYRRLVIRRRRIVGALGVGAWSDVNRIQQAVRAGGRIWPWQAWRFARTGRLRREGAPAPVGLWPAAATVCNCTGVTRGRLGDAIVQGAASIDALTRETSAGSVCGTCRPLLQELLGGKVEHRPVPGARAIAVASLVAAAIVFAAVVLPPWPYSRSVDAGIGLDRLWTSGTWKQVTGFSLVALSALVALLSLRKRLGWSWLGAYAWWRVVHALVGATAVALLFLHTGFNLGRNLNRIGG
jgi:nitrite reductase (NADH) large subunit